MNRTSRIAAIALLSLVASACSGTDDDSGADGTAADATTPASGSAATTDSVAPGEVRQTLRIGFAYQDVGAFAVLNDKFSIGEVELQAAAVLEAWRRDGLLPVNGVDLEFVFAEFNHLSPEDQLGVCTRFAQDEEVFAVISSRDFPIGAKCLTERYGIPVIDSSGLARSDYELGAPWLFTVRADQSQVMEFFVKWAEAKGAFDGKRIGLYWDTRSEEAHDAFVAALAEIGVEIASDLPSDGEGIGSPQDAIVVQRFVSDGADMAILMVGSSSVTNFLASAAEQGYAPTLLFPEWANQLTDVSTQSFPQGLVDGAEAMTMSRVGEVAAGFDLNPQAVACVDNYEAFSGEEVELVSPESGETNQTLFTCDLMSILLEGLRNAGDNPTKESFVAALEKITDFPLAAWGNVTFTPDDHAGVDQVRTIRWSSACECWTAEGDFEDLSG
ncbi:MAG: ABC transporter substrate-binding protein [Actinomycetia bacterium]|nr:ABC transporter substrate-binding protein [Actinomycetes bacterium]